MESSLKIYKIKPDKKAKLLQFVEGMKAQKEAAESALTEANMFVESIFIYENLLYVFKVSENLEQMKERQSSSELPLYAPVRAIIEECLEEYAEVPNSIGFYRKFSH